jgi:GDP/UDP-N,N'-diacetylbacillosamine 2-epimerase (hydrolysing)
MIKRACVVTGSRAEYGLLRGVMAGIRDASDMELQVVATGMHLSPEFGLTYHEIEDDGFAIAERVEILLSSDSAVGIGKAMGLGLIGFADAFARLKPDLLILLGDRFETLAAAAAALVVGIPIAHIHGGESSEGAFDEAIRHSVTKMSHLHFTAAVPYRDRVIQLGEEPDRVFMVGGLGVDAIRALPLMSREEVEAKLGFDLGVRTLLVTFHPPTLDYSAGAEQLSALLEALDSLGPETRLVFTMPNADTGGRELMDMIEHFAATREHARAYSSLGQLLYLSCMAQVDGVVGNSSSGLAEAPSLGIGTVNIGDRQAGRLKASSVIDCAPQQSSIEAALQRLFSTDFRASLANVVNPYGSGGASEAIVRVLRTHRLEGLLKKRFHDLPRHGGTRDEGVSGKA